MKTALRSRPPVGLAEKAGPTGSSGSVVVRGDEVLQVLRGADAPARGQVGLGDGHLDLFAVVLLDAQLGGGEPIEVQVESIRSEERRVGQECVGKCISRWW